MTVKELKAIIRNLPEDTVILIEENDVNEVGTIEVQYHSDGRVHVVLSVME